MKKIVEKDLEFDFSDAIDAIQFDDDTYHAGSNIERVDFIVEYDSVYRFVEVKDPDIPGCKNLNLFMEKFKSGKLIHSLSGKFRDSLFFRTIQKRTDKRIEYIVLLSMKGVDDALLLNKQDQLHKAIPFSHHDWSDNSAAACVILNVRQWKKRFGNSSIRRLSGGAL